MIGRYSRLSIRNLIKVLKQLPYLTFLDIRSEILSEIKDEADDNEFDKDRFDNIERLQVCIDVQWEIVSCLLKYFPKLINLHVFGIPSTSELNSMLGSFPLDDAAAGTEYCRWVDRIKQKKDQDILHALALENQ